MLTFLAIPDRVPRYEADHQLPLRIEGLESEGWLATRDVNTGRGNIDTIVVGPGGVFTVEVKSRGGKLRPDGIEPAMLRQAYAQRKWLERVKSHPATALLVFSRAYSWQSVQTLKAEPKLG